MKSINFIYDKCGNTGKSFCANYLELFENCYILPCIDDYNLVIKNVYNAVTTKKKIKAFILDIPHDMIPHDIKLEDMHNLLFAIRTIKKGKYFDFKYESHQISASQPSIFIFIKETIEFSTYFDNKYKIWRINENLELESYTFLYDNQTANTM